MSYMAHQIIEEITIELASERTTRPEIHRDSQEESAVIALAVLLRQYGVHKTSTYANAARLIIDAYPELIPVFGVNP